MPKKGEYVYRRKDGLWEARYVKEITSSGKKKFGSVYAHSCKEAKEKRQKIIDNIILPKSVSTTDMTFIQLIEEWLDINKHRLKPSTYQRYKGYCKNHIVSTIGNCSVLSFTTSYIRNFALDRLEYGLSPRSINSILVFINTCLKYGNREYKTPITDIIYFPESQQEMRVLTREEQGKLVTYLLENMDIYKFGILLTLYTGLRIGELCALQWGDIENDCIKVRKTMLRIPSETHTGTELIVVSPKTDTSVRTIPIPSFMLEMVGKFSKNKAAKDYLLSTDKKIIVEPRTMQYRLKKIYKDLDITGATFHSLRHTFATRGVEVGFDIKSLSELMGHSGVQTTLNLYVHSSIEQKRNNIELLPLIT